MHLMSLKSRFTGRLSRQGREPDPQRTVAGARTDDPAAMALAALHRDGRVRAAAVEALLSTGRPETLPFIAVRAADWTPQVRDRARAGLALALHAPSRETLEILPCSGMPTGARCGGAPTRCFARSAAGRGRAPR